jgi:hypothetical protein
MAHGMHLATDRDRFAGRGLGPAIRGQRHSGFRGDHKRDPALVQLPKIRAIQKASIEDDFGQARVARHIALGLRD